MVLFPKDRKGSKEKHGYGPQRGRAKSVYVFKKNTFQIVIGKNLVFTTCANYKRSELEVFVGSLRRHVEDAKLVVFTSNLGEETQQWLREQGATLVPMQISGWRRGVFNRYRKFTKANPLRFLPRTLALRWAFHTAPIMSLRFLYYRRWLSQQAGKYEKVFITDSKDVVFQGDPFSCLQNEEVQFFLENHTIGTPNDVNAIWMGWVYPPQESHFLFGQKNSCAGTTLGSTSGIFAYLKSMNDEFVRAVLTPRHGEDQAMHNMILRRKRCNFQRRAVPNGEGAVLTVLGCPPEDYILGPDDLVRNKAGQVIPVLHTYDRFPELVKAQKRRLGLNGFQQPALKLLTINSAPPQTFFQELIRSAGDPPASHLGPKPTDPSEIKAREAEAARLTQLLERGKKFSFVRLGDIDLALLIAAQAGKDSPEFAPQVESTSGTQPAGAPGVTTRSAGRLKNALENADYVDFHERLWPVSTLLPRLRLSRRKDLERNPNAQASYILLTWMEREFKGFCERHRVGFAGAEASILQILSRRPEFREAACEVWPSGGAQFFHQPRNNGDQLEANLDLIKQDLKAFVQKNQIDTLFLSLGAGAKILAYELADELYIRGVDFGAMLRGLCYMGSDGNRVGRSTHFPFYHRLDFDLVMNAIEESFPSLKPEQLLAKAHAQLILEVQEKEHGWTHGNKELRLDSESIKNFRDAEKKYRRRYSSLWGASPLTKAERANFLHFCGTHGLTMQGRLFLAGFKLKSLVARCCKPRSQQKGDADQRK